MSPNARLHRISGLNQTAIVSADGLWKLTAAPGSRAYWKRQAAEAISSARGLRDCCKAMPIPCGAEVAILLGEAAHCRRKAFAA